MSASYYSKYIVLISFLICTVFVALGLICICFISMKTNRVDDESKKAEGTKKPKRKEKNSIQIAKERGLRNMEMGFTTPQQSYAIERNRSGVTKQRGSDITPVRADDMAIVEMESVVCPPDVRCEAKTY